MITRFVTISVGILPLFILAEANTLQAMDVPKADEAAVECCQPSSRDVRQYLQNADRLYAQFKPKEASKELHKVLQADPSNVEAILKLCRAQIDIGDMIPESAQDWKETRLKEYTKAEDYARKAVVLNPNSTWSYFYLAASLGNVAVLSPRDKQIGLAGDVRTAVEKSIALDPANGFAYHVYGVWQRKMAEIGSASRVFASLVYRQSIPTGSLEKSIEYLKKAVALNPSVIVSRLELAKSYLAVENLPSARNLLASIRKLPIQFSDDARHKKEAEELLEQIKDR
jgi:tetratricopeptide (TPR) repeat protein